MILRSNTSGRRPASVRPPAQNLSRKATQNRRSGRSGGRQTHLLEVKARWRAVAHHRVSAVFKMMGYVVLLGASLCALVFGGQRALDAAFFENPRYTLREVRIESDGTLTRDQILNVTRIREGTNLFRVNIDASRRALEGLSQVHTAEVERLLPGTIVVRVEERKPVAWIVPRGKEEDPYSPVHSLLADARGTLLRIDEVLPEYHHLPLILGVRPELIAPGEPISAPEVRAALDLLRINGLGTLQTRFQIRTIDISREYCLRVTDQRKAELTFGLEDLEHQLDNYQRLTEYGDATGQEIQTANLALQRNIPVTFFPLPEIEPVLETGLSEAAAGTKPDASAKSKTPEKTQKSPPPVPVRRAVPVWPQQGGTKNG